MLVNFFRDARQHGNVMVAPQAELDIGRDIRRVVDLHHLGADHGPAALRLHAAHGGEGRGIAVAHAVAMGHLVEAVARHMGADADGFEENVVAGIAGHDHFQVAERTVAKPEGPRLCSDRNGHMRGQHAADIQRHRDRGAAAEGPCREDTRDRIAQAQRDHRRAHPGEGGVPAAHGLLQVPRRVEPHLAARRRNGAGRGRGLFLRQPCAGRCGGGTDQGTSRTDRDAGGHAADQAGQYQELWRGGRHL